MEKETSQMEGITAAAADEDVSKNEKERQNETIGAERAQTEEEEKEKLMEANETLTEQTKTERKTTEISLPMRLHVGNLTRNVTEEHLRMIFSVWGPLKTVEIAIDPVVQLPKGYATIEFEKREDGENALDHMHGGQIDGNIVEVKFTQPSSMRKTDSTTAPVVQQRSEARSMSQRTDHQGRTQESERRRSPVRGRRRSPVRRHSRSPPRRRSPYRHRTRSPHPRRRPNYNGGYPYGNRGPSPANRRRRSPYRPRRRSPSLRYKRREPTRTSPSKRSRRTSTSSSSSMSKSSSMSTSASSSASSSN